MEKFSDIQGLEFDRMRNVVRILRKEFKTEVQYIMGAIYLSVALTYK